MYAVTAEAMREMDRVTMEELGLPGVVLMENAGARVAEELLKLDHALLKHVLILAGHGNNGGDGAVVARKLRDEGLTPKLWLTGDLSRLEGDASIHFNAYTSRGYTLHTIGHDGLDLLQTDIEQATIIVDAMLGTGIEGPLREPYHTIIERVNESGKFTVAVDLPSGLHSDTGRVNPIAINADLTITFVYPKQGFFLDAGPQQIGKWKAVHISVPPSLADSHALQLSTVMTQESIQRILPMRPANGHKGTFGHALIIGGAASYAGAPAFSAQAALAGGAGLVTMATPSSLHPIVSSLVPEALQLPLSEQDGHLTSAGLKKLIAQAEHYDVVAIGPGLSRFEEAEEFVMETLRSFRKKPIIMDADALYAVRNRLDDIRLMNLPSLILTPHPGEMAALCHCSISEIEKDRLGAARAFAERYGVFLVLKGHRSIAAGPDGMLSINPSGNDALGKGGSGDVLTGFLAALLAQGISPYDAMQIAVYIHARAGEEAGEQYSNYSVLPKHVIAGISSQLRTLTVCKEIEETNNQW